MLGNTLFQLSSGRYYQGCGTIKKCGSESAMLGKKVLIVAEKEIFDKVKENMCSSFEDADVAWTWHAFEGGCCEKNYNTIAKTAKEEEAQVILGVGGGRAIDTAKIASDLANIRCITFPTSAATCACTAWLAVEYENDGSFIDNYWPKYSPACTIVDLDYVVYDCPARYNAAGLIDALAKYPEIKYNLNTTQNWEKNAFSQCAVNLSEHMFNFLLENGEEYLQKCQRGIVDSQIEDSIGNILCITGLCSAFSGGGKQAAICHNLYSYFCTYQKWLSEGFLHGELVGASMLYQMYVISAQKAQTDALRKLMKALSLPTCLRDLGFVPSNKERNEMFDYLQQTVTIDTQEEMKRLRTMEDILIDGIEY